MNTPEFDRFIEASRITALEIDRFVARAQYWEPGSASLSIFDQAGPETELPKVNDRLQKLFIGRRSSRTFSEVPISANSLAQVLSAAGSDDDRPVVPSAGGLDPVQIYAFVRRSGDEFDGQVLRYLHREHRVSTVGTVPDAERCRRLFALDCEGTPVLLLAFVVDPAATLGKYGERGGRFLLQQVGHAMQNVGLRLAETQRRQPLSLRRTSQRLHGYVVGGILDEVLTTIGLAHTRAVLVGGYAIGASD